MVHDENFNAVLIRNPLKAKSDEWKDTAHQWEITLYGQKFEYYTGLAHRTYKGFSSMKYEFDRLEFNLKSNEQLKNFLTLSKPTPPKADDVIYSLIWDASATEQSFEEWCAEFGYNDDSIKAMDTYRACQQNSNKLRKMGLNIEAERDRLQDY